VGSPIAASRSFAGNAVGGVKPHVGDGVGVGIGVGIEDAKGRDGDQADRHRGDDEGGDAAADRAGRPHDHESWRATLRRSSAGGGDFALLHEA
jgi:hypothetical protein